MSNEILEIKNLSKHYEGFSLNNISFSIPYGYIMGFIGPNGAGKTTTIKSILNMIYPDSGEIMLFGEKAPSYLSEVKNKIGVVMDLPFYVDDWKIKDVEAAISPFYSHWNYDIFNSYVHEFNLVKNKKVKELSRGMKVKLMIAVALSHNAKLLILDEPTSGLDPVARDELMDILKKFITDKSNSILFSTHITSDLEKIADYITFIINGNIVFTGEKDKLLESYLLIEGELYNITAEQKKNIIGFHEHNTNFRGMIKADDTKIFLNNFMIEKISLDEIIIYMNREVKIHEQNTSFHKT